MQHAQATILADIKSSGIVPFKYTKTGKRRSKSTLWSASAKIDKSESSGDADLALVLYFKPGAFCPFMSAGCYAACLGSHAGRMVMGTVQQAQVNRSVYYLTDRAGFIAELAESARRKVAARVRKLGRHIRVTIRLNGTSDLQGLSRVRQAIREACSDLPADLNFYEYSKNWDLVGKYNLDYHLTLSRSENTTDAQLSDAIRRGINVAVVFDVKPDEPMPTKWNGYDVIDGRKSDDRTRDPISHLNSDGDPMGCIVGLSALGRMTRDKSGMVVRLK